MSVLAGQGGRGLRDRVTYGGTSPCESSYSRARGRLSTAPARCSRVACRPLEAVEEGRTDFVVTNLASADDELAGRVGDGVAELHVIDRGIRRLDDDRRDVVPMLLFSQLHKNVIAESSKSSVLFARPLRSPRSLFVAFLAAC